MTPYSRPLKPAPKQLFENDAFHIGSFDAPIHNPNLIDAKRPYSLPLPRFLKWMQLREWQAFQISNGTHFVMIAIYNAKKISLVQFIVYDIKNNKKYRYEKKVPAWSLHVPNGLFGTQAFYRSNNFSITAKHDLRTNKLEISASIKKGRSLPALTATFSAQHDTGRYDPMVVCMPFCEKRVMYSHKCLIPVHGKIEIGEQRIDFPNGSSQLIIDDHKGYYPYPTRYDWVTGLGRDENGKMIGFNLTDNQVINQENNNENCLWHNGRLSVLPPIKVNRPNGYEGEWIIADKYGMVDLKFSPVIHNAVDVNLLFMRSKYQGPYGYFSGQIQNSEGEKITIKNMFGMGEDFYLRA